MPDRKPERGESSASGPFCTIPRPRGIVEVWGLSDDRYSIRVSGHPEQIVVGHDAAMQAAEALAEELD